MWGSTTNSSRTWAGRRGEHNLITETGALHSTSGAEGRRAPRNLRARTHGASKARKAVNPNYWEVALGQRTQSRGERGPWASGELVAIEFKLDVDMGGRGETHQATERRMWKTARRLRVGGIGKRNQRRAWPTSATDACTAPPRQEWYHRICATDARTCCA